MKFKDPDEFAQIIKEAEELSREVARLSEEVKFQTELVDTMTQENVELKNEIANRNAEFETLKQDYTDIMVENADLYEERRALMNEVDEANAKIIKLSETASNAAEVTSAVKEQFDLLSQHLTVSSAEVPAEFVDTTSQPDYVSEYFKFANSKDKQEKAKAIAMANNPRYKAEIDAAIMGRLSGVSKKEIDAPVEENQIPLTDSEREISNAYINARDRVKEIERIAFWEKNRDLRKERNELQIEKTRLWAKHSEIILRGIAQKS